MNSEHVLIRPFPEWSCGARCTLGFAVTENTADRNALMAPSRGRYVVPARNESSARTPSKHSRRKGPTRFSRRRRQRGSRCHSARRSLMDVISQFAARYERTREEELSLEEKRALEAKLAAKSK